MFQISNKYKLTADFIKRIIEPAKKELDEKSPYTFHYNTIKTGRKITGIRFIPIHQPQFEDPELKKKRLNKQISNRWYISKNIEDYLIHNFDFTKKELNNNLNLFEGLYNKLTEEEIIDLSPDQEYKSIYKNNIQHVLNILNEKLQDDEKIYFIICNIFCFTSNCV